MFRSSLRSKLKAGQRRFLRSYYLCSSSARPGLQNGGWLSSPVSSVLCLDESRRYMSRFAYPEGMKAHEDDWTEEPEYPEIDPETHQWNEHRRQRRQKVLDWHNRIKNAPCPEAKIFEYNYPRQYGYKNFRITEDYFDYNCQDAYKFITRTHVASTNQLPSKYFSPELDDKVKHFKEKIKGPLSDVLAFELDMPRSHEEHFNSTLMSVDLKKSQTIIPQINRVILSILGEEIDYFKDCAVDVLPKVEAFWEVGGMQPSLLRRKQRKGCEKIKMEFQKPKYVKPDDPIEHHMHYVGQPLLQVRFKDPPENFVSVSDALCKRSLEKFPDVFPHFLQAYGFHYPAEYKYRFCSIIPGHWSGDERRCNLLAFHPRHYLLFRERLDSKYWNAEDETEVSLFSQAMLVSFGRLLGEALYHGFDQFVDVEYPFSTQTIITNGLDWSFFAYQLNTLKLDKLSLPQNDKQNVLWGTKSESIFDKEKKGELNDTVLENLLRFYLNPPKPIKAKHPTPYLTKRIQDDWGEETVDPENPDTFYVQRRHMQRDWKAGKIQKERKRLLYYYNHKEMCTQRIYVTDNLLHKRPPEMYEWEKIYKFYFKTRPMDKRLRYFEFPKDFPGADPLNEPYEIKHPLIKSKGVLRLIDEMKKKKEEEKIEAAKQAEAKQFGVVYTNPKKSRK